MPWVIHDSPFGEPLVTREAFGEFVVDGYDLFQVVPFLFSTNRISLLRQLSVTLDCSYSNEIHDFCVIHRARPLRHPNPEFFDEIQTCLLLANLSWKHQLWPQLA